MTQSGAEALCVTSARSAPPRFAYRSESPDDPQEVRIRLFDAVTSRDEPFYGFFDTHQLDELTFENAVRLIGRIAAQEENTELARVLASPRGRARVRAVHHLAAGNPRVYVIFSQFLTVDALDKLVEPLLHTLDDLTPYYQGRMSHLSPLRALRAPPRSSRGLRSWLGKVARSLAGRSARAASRATPFSPEGSPRCSCG